MISSIREKALKAAKKASPYGPDIELQNYEYGSPNAEILTEESIPKTVQRYAKNVGVDFQGAKSGVYLQVDHSLILAHTMSTLREKGVVVTSTMEALRRWNWVKDYYWKAVPVDLDKYTATAEIQMRHGYFIYVPKNVKIEEPIQACLFVSKNRIAQPVHNIIIADEGAKLNLVTGCTTAADEGLHIGISEFYVKKGAEITFTMVHGWSRHFHVRPRAAAIVEEDGVFVNYYINLHSTSSLQMFPTLYLHERARGYITAVLLGKGSSKLDVGGRIVLLGSGARGEIASRGIIRDRSVVTMRGHLLGRSEATRGHLECRGLLLSKAAVGKAVPLLESEVEGAYLTHEAAIGKISEEELAYLMFKGFSEEEATSLIVRGFLDVGLENLPANLQDPVKRLLDMIARGSF